MAISVTKTGTDLSPSTVSSFSGKAAAGIRASVRLVLDRAEHSLAASFARQYIRCHSRREAKLPAPRDFRIETPRRGYVNLGHAWKRVNSGTTRF